MASAHRQCLVASLHVKRQYTVNKIPVAELCCMHSYAKGIPAKDWEPASDTLLPTGSQCDPQSTGELKFSTQCLGAESRSQHSEQEVLNNLM